MIVLRIIIMVRIIIIVRNIIIIIIIITIVSIDFFRRLLSPVSPAFIYAFNLSPHPPI